jgi:hypothetical protein
MSLQDKIDKTYLPDINNPPGSPTNPDHRRTLFTLAKELNSMSPLLVIDVGCGFNQLKPHVKNLIGFDRLPYPTADLQADIETVHFEPESADAIVALGSLHFGNKVHTFNQLSIISKWLKVNGRLFMRCRTLASLASRKQGIADIFYIWNLADIIEAGKLYGLELYTQPVVEFENQRNERLYWVWERKQ